MTPTATVAAAAAAAAADTDADGGPAAEPTFVPADTRTMRIVHNAMRRDLARAREVLASLPYPHDVQRVALADHLLMIMAFLHKHHEAEETGLYPLVRRDPAAAALIEEMEADHDRLDPGIAAVEQAARAYRADAAVRPALIAALDLLHEPLWPHLEREEDVLMPVVERTVSKAEWDRWEREIAKSRSLPDLAREGLWILDGATPEEQALMCQQVPAPVLWVLRHVFGRGYRKRAFARWWDPQLSPWKLQILGSNAVVSTASPEQVWAVLADVTRTGEWSHECHTVRWLDDRRGLGARFAGANRNGRMRWSRPCEITEWEPARLLQYRTKGPRLIQDCSEWTFVLEPVEGGTRITQTFRGIQLPILIDRLIYATFPAHRDRNEALRGDLERLAALAAAG
jgi:hemerythrin-like domain-containing protein